MNKTLPISAIKTEFLELLEQQSTLILSAPPGAGKSTELPLWLVTHPLFSKNKIYLLQPRRVAAKNIACYLAKQLGEPVGERVGYRLRNETKTSKSTILEVITEGILTQIIQNDPEMLGCSLVIFDEFHERSVHADLALALSRDVQQGLREDLKILLMSATLTTAELLIQLPDAKLISSDGRSYPVEVDYRPPSTARIWREHTLTIIKEQVSTHQASILVFLPGTADIRFLAQALESKLPDNMMLCPLYGDMSLKAQQQAIAPSPAGINKLVLATNIAETSLTIEGVTLVIDSGLEKIAVYDDKTMTNRLKLQSIPKSSAIQRAGRAGRLSAGKCLRLFSEEDFTRRAEQNVSAIQQTDLLPILIEAARWGVKSLSELPLLEFPPVNKESNAWQVLNQLEIVDEQRRLTSFGEQISQYSCHPRFAHMISQAKILEPKQKGLTALACIIAALLEERDILKGDQARISCDFRLRVFECLRQKNQGRSALNAIALQAQRLYEQTKVKSFLWKNLEDIVSYCGVLLALAYPERIAKKRQQSGEFLAVSGKGLSINPEDNMVDEPFIVVAQASEYRNKLNVQLAAAVDIEQLKAWNIVRPITEQVLAYDHHKDRIIAEQQSKLGAITLERTVTNNKITADEIAALWLAQLKKNGLNWLSWNKESLALLTKWRWLNIHQAHLSLPDVSEAGLMVSIEHWFMPYVGQIKTKAQLTKLDFNKMLLSLLDYQQQTHIEKYAPSHFVGPTGRRCAIRYSDEKSPTVSLPMQELYGQTTTPSVGDINNNKAIALVLELLSPAQRPIQVTQDLPTFWQGSYKDVQKDMRSRYPKHYWPDDPQNAVPTRKTKRHIKE